MELYFSFPGESNDFINHAAPAILRLIDAMGHAQTNATVKAVHAVLLRATCPERVGDADKPVYQRGPRRPSACGARRGAAALARRSTRRRREARSARARRLHAPA